MSDDMWFEDALKDSLDIAVLCGGDSSQREVSLASGEAVAAALLAAGHNVAVFDPSDAELTALNWHQFDACFIALHGGEGEDGRVQSVLDQLGVPYTGSGPDASRLAMSKWATKERLRQHGIATPPAVTIHADDPLLEVVRRVRSLGFPLVVKPDGQGCSLGVGVARCLDDLTECLARAAEYESSLLAEKLIVGREMTVAIVDGEPLPPLEIVHDGPLFDFDAKHHSPATTLRVPEVHDSAALVAVQTAMKAAAALETRCLVRVDLIVDGAGCPWVLELNTSPDMTERSLAPRAASAAGLKLSALCDQLIRKCLASVEVPA
ncbi:MAG: D-alanine--D-alanine ligase [Planctomycetia bacterium]|nr:D-alanine--D-alanine ligase [Planctomycetia bacterium]